MKPFETEIAENSTAFTGRWRRIRTTVFAKDRAPVANKLLNLASIKDSYLPYQQECAGLYA